jgi:dihydrofolate synthase/folylpolyglutamate synthase
MPQIFPLSLDRRQQGRIRPELGPVRQALGRLGDPQLAYPSILIVGTNGKGSTAVMLEAMLRQHGLVTGVTTSPHLVSVEERVRLDGRLIARSALAEYLDRMTVFSDLTFFETVTAAAFLAFAETGVDVAILEAGMGGTWDATRVAQSSIAGITNVGTDHAKWLGETAEERAREKGAALRDARRAVIGPGLAPELLPALAAPKAVHARDLVELRRDGTGRLRVRWEGAELLTSAPLAGDHQIGNLHLALALARCAASEGLMARLDPAAVAEGLGRVRWPGRLSKIHVRSRPVLVDGAHNPEGAKALAAELGKRPERYNLVFSCLDDKPVEEMARILEPVVGDIAVCPIEDLRAMSVERLAAAFPRALRAVDVAQALDLLSDPVVAAGSLRLAGRLFELADEGGVP